MLVRWDVFGGDGEGFQEKNVHQCYFIGYDKHKGWIFLLATTVNRVDSVDWKHLRLFYLAPLRGCAKYWRHNRNWGRAWLVNVKSSTPGQLEGFFSYIFRVVEYCLNKTYASNIRCDAGRVFEYTYDTVTVGSSNTVRLRLIGNCPDISGFFGIVLGL